MLDPELEQSVDAYVDEVWDDVVADIAAVVSHPSVVDEQRAAPGAPFGPEVRSALDCALDVARKLGYQVSDDEGYVGMADIPGADDVQIATIAHVDVVPAGNGWDTDPFTVARREGWLIGRGVADDKGPAVLSLYAGAYFLKRGITPRHSFRALLGCDEEVGMTDVHHYLAGHAAPAFLFTPDASFPVCNAEKGLFDMAFVSPVIEGGNVVSFTGGTVANAVPGEAELVVKADAAQLAATDRVAVEPAGPGLARLSARGVGGHASLPEGTVNAIGLLVSYVRANHLLAPAEEPYFELLAAIHADTAGKALGVAACSEAFGPLTCIGGTMRFEGGRFTQTIDIRFPDSTSADELAEKLCAQAARFGAEGRVGMTKPPFSVSADSPAVQALLATYNEVTGNDAQLLSMGGGTYARNFPCAVSFGPEEEVPDQPAWAGPMHGPNEAAKEELLRRALKIYVIALVRLMDLDYEA